MWQDEFVDLLKKCPITEDTMRKALEFKLLHLPKKIYKYRSFDKYNYSIENLKNDTLWFCSPSKFNDPYESVTILPIFNNFNQYTQDHFDSMFTKVCSQEHLSKDEIKNAINSPNPIGALFKQIIRKNNKITERESALLDAVIYMFTKTPESANNSITDFNQSMVKLCSFSARNESIVMWAHYSHSHTGYCIEYNVEAWPLEDKKRYILFPVLYTSKLFDASEYFKLVLNGDSFSMLYIIIASIFKSPDWSYESEWRLVHLTGMDDIPDKNMPISKPSALYLGSKISKEDEETLKEIAKRKEIPVFKMQLSPNEFKMVPIPIDV